MNMSTTGTPPKVVFQKQDGFWFSYSPDGKYIAVVVADMQNAVISAARLAAKSNARPVGEGVAPDAIASSSGSLHPATPRWLEIIDASTFQTLHKLEGVAGLEEYFYWSPRSRYIVTWQPLSVASASSSYPTGLAPNSGPANSSNPTSSNFAGISTNSTNSSDSPNLKVWDVQTGKVVMHFKHGQRQGWPMLRWTEDEKIACRWASGQIHLYHWAKATFNQSPEENFAAMTRETIDKQNVWDWSVARSALAVFIRGNAANGSPAQVHLYPLNTTLGEEQSTSSSTSSQSLRTSSEEGRKNGGMETISKQTSASASTSASTTSSSSSSTSSKNSGQTQGKTKGQQQAKGQNSPKNKPNQIPLNTAPPKEPNMATGEGGGLSSSSSSSSFVTQTQDSQQTEQTDIESSTLTNNGSSQKQFQSQQPPLSHPPLTSMAPEKPICSKSFFKCDDVHFRWHNRGQALLVLAMTQKDESGSGKYYGNTFVSYLPVDGKGECDVTTDKEGPIHDARWNAKGNDFAITYGEYPSKTTLYNRKCKALGHLGTESRNELVWSPQGRVLMSGGFGQLPGNFDIWDTVSLSKLGSAQSFTSAHHEWSPDGKFLLSAALWPRMRVDNFFSIYDLKANHLVNVKLQELWKITWRPQPGCSSAYPPSPQDPIVVATPPQTVVSSQSKAPSAPYRPPGAKRAATSQFAQSQVPLKEVKVAPERFAPPSNPNAKQAKSAAATTTTASSSSSSSTPPPTKVPVGGMPVKKSSSPGHRQNNKSPKPSGGQ
jgi:uncharacterized protein with WD repeat